MARDYNMGHVYRNTKSNIPIVLKTGETFKNVDDFNAARAASSNSSSSSGLLEFIIITVLGVLFGKLSK